jgi:REP element-mobilizing transposase RayT
MAHPYPPHHDDVPYVGKYHYSLMFCTDDRRPVFVDPKPVELVLAQFMRAANEQRYVLTAYCFMPDHVHLMVSGLSDDSDLNTSPGRSSTRVSISSASMNSAYGSGMVSSISSATKWSWRRRSGTSSRIRYEPGWCPIPPSILTSARPGTRSRSCSRFCDYDRVVD